MKNSLQAAIAIVFMLLMAGCATTIGRDYDQGKVNQFVPGKTTMDQVIADLGQPTERETESNGEVRLHYQFIVSKSSVTDYVPFAPVKANTSDKDTFLYFDRNGKYMRAENNQSNM